MGDRPLHRPDSEGGQILDLVIRCTCGERVVSRHVIQQRFFLSLFGPSHIYIRYRCGRCRRVGERYIPEDQWHPGLLRSDKSAQDGEQMQRFRKMGAITLDEVIDFHFALERLSADPDVALTPADPGPADQH